MRTREALLNHLWQTTIDSILHEGDMADVIALAKAHPDAPFTEAASVMERLLAIGTSAKDTGTLRRHAAYRSMSGIVGDSRKWHQVHWAIGDLTSPVSSRWRHTLRA
jgi:hypothetical protein